MPTADDVPGRPTPAHLEALAGIFTGVQRYIHSGAAVLLGICGHWWQAPLERGGPFPVDDRQLGCPRCGRPVGHILPADAAIYPDCAEAGTS